ncbi:phosphohydrolase [Synergistales bacterium]|nr:phosphohydrolase [Synergistales bacterium]
MFADYKRIEEWFIGYARNFDLSVSMIQMKYRHSFDVMRFGKRIAQALKWTDGDAAVGVAACLLHDTGRFSQYREFGTYHDGASIDHGERAYEVLKAELPYDMTDDEARDAILQAVRWHNKKELPRLSPSVTPFCRLARDSDKLDIFKMVDGRIEDGTVGELLPRHKVDAPISEVLLDELERNWRGSYKNASSLQDFLLIQLTWTLDINFAPALRLLEESGVLTRIRARFPEDDARVQALLDRLFALIEEHKESLA